MIYCCWKSSVGNISLFSCPSDQVDGLVNEVVLFPAAESDSRALEAFPDFGTGAKVRLTGSFAAGRVFTAIILAQANKAVKSLPGPGRILLFAEGLIGESVRVALPEEARDGMVVARVLKPGESPASAEGELDPFSPGFVDILKAITEGEGFSSVILASSQPELVKTAMGCAGVLGRVSFLLPIEDRVLVDLTATLNFKSLIVQGRSIFAGLEYLLAQDIEEAEQRIDSISARFAVGGEASGLEIVSG